MSSIAIVSQPSLAIAVSVNVCKPGSVKITEGNFRLEVRLEKVVSIDVPVKSQI